MIYSPLRSPLRSPVRSPLARAIASGLPGTYYDFTGASLPAPWDTLRRAGLGTRVEADGDLGYGAHNLAVQSETHAGATLGGAAGSGTPPTISAGSYLGVTCEQIAFPAGVTGFGASRRTGNTAGQSGYFVQSAGFVYNATINIALSRALVAGESIDVVATGVDTLAGALQITSATSGQTVFTRRSFASGTAASSGAMGVFVYSTLGLLSPISVYITQTLVCTGALTTYVPTTTSAVFLPRPTHNPSTLAALGLLFEGQATNLLGMTEQFDNVYWTKVACTVTANTTPAPDGTTSADSVIPSTASGLHYIRRDVTVTASAHTVQIWAEPAGYSGIWISMDGASNYALFTLTGAGSASSTSGDSARIQRIGNRYLCTYTRTLAAGTAACFIGVSNPAGSIAGFTGDGVSGVAIWGAQLETGTVPTSYIPNPTTGTALRQGDFAGGGISGAALSALLPGTPEVLGANRVTNGTGTSLTGWTTIGAGGSLALVGGEFEMTGSGGGYPGARVSVSGLTPTRSYRLSLTARRGTTSATITAFAGAASVNTTATTNTPIQVEFTASGTSVNVDVLLNAASASGTAYFDDVSVREVVTPAIPGPQLPFTIVLPFRKANNAAAVETLIGLCAGASAGTTNQLGIAMQGTQAQIVHSGGSGALTGTLVLDGSTVNRVAVSVDPTARGPDGVTNGEFAAGTSNWLPETSGVLSASAGILRITNSGGANGRAFQAISTVVNRTYEVTVVATNRSAGATYEATVRGAGSFGPTYGTSGVQTAAGTYRFFFQAALTSHTVCVFAIGADGQWAEWDSVSVREVGAASISVNGSAPVETTGIAYTGSGTTHLIPGARDSSGGQAAMGFTSPGIRVAAGQYITGSALQALST